MSTYRPLLRFETAFGAFWVELFPDLAPVTVHNFLQYVNEGRYANARFYRVVTADNQPNDAVKIAVIQGGLGMEPHPLRLPAIPHETTAQSGLRHRDGTISMSRLAPHTAGSEFFFCIGDQPELDFGGARNPDGQGFAAFGRTVRGLEVLRAIHAQPHGGQALTPAIAVSVSLEPQSASSSAGLEV